MTLGVALAAGDYKPSLRALREPLSMDMRPLIRKSLGAPGARRDRAVPIAMKRVPGEVDDKIDSLVYGRALSMTESEN